MKNFPDSQTLNWVEEDGVKKAYVILRKGDWAFDPASTTRKIYGPCRLVYTKYRDGAVEVSVVSPNS